MKMFPHPFLNCRSIITGACLVVGILSLAACLDDGGDNPSVPPAQFSSIGFLPGYASSQTVAVSADGLVVAGIATTATGATQAFRWTATQGMSALGFLPGGGQTIATAVSADGNIVVGTGNTSAEPATPSSGFRWTANGGIVRIDPVPGSYLCTASGVSGDGQTVVGTCLTFNNEAFRWTQDTGAVGLGRFGGGSNQTSSAAAISSNGTVIVGAGHPILTGAVAWPASGNANVLGKLSGDDSAIATAISRDGTVTVGTSYNAASVGRAFRWTQQTGMVALGTVSGIVGSMATAVSGDGRIVVGWATTATGDSAFIWDAEHGLRSLEAALVVDHQTEITGWKLTRATAISDDGRTIAGYGTNPQGQIEGWIVKLPS